MWNAGPPDFLRREQEKKFTPVTAFPIEHPLNSVGVLRPVNDGTYEQTSIQPQYQTQGYEVAATGAKVINVNNDDPTFVPVTEATPIGGGRSKHRRKKSRKTKTRRRKTKTRRRKTKTRRRKSRR